MKQLIFLSGIFFVGCGSTGMVTSNAPPDTDANCDCDVVAVVVMDAGNTADSTSGDDGSVANDASNNNDVSCTCPNGTNISGQSITGVCGQTTICGTDGNYWTCSPDGQWTSLQTSCSTSNDSGTVVSDAGNLTDGSSSNDASGDSGLCDEERNDPSPYCERQLHCCMDQCKTVKCSVKHTTCVHKCEEQHKECVGTVGGCTQ